MSNNTIIQPDNMSGPFGLIAGNGVFPLIAAKEYKKQMPGSRLVCCAFNAETDPSIAPVCDAITWLKVGQLSKMIAFLKKEGVSRALMAGQITPKRAIDLALTDMRLIKLMARVKERGAEPIFRALADELAQEGITLVDSIMYLKDYMAPKGLIYGKKLSAETSGDVSFGFNIAAETARLNIGQTVVVRKKAVIAVEGIDGTDETIRRGGRLAPGAVVVKVAKHNQDMRFDVPVIGPKTIEVCIESSISVLAVQAAKTLMLEKEKIEAAISGCKKFTLLGG